MIIVQLILYCALFTLMVKLGVGNSALNGLFFYPKVRWYAIGDGRKKKTQKPKGFWVFEVRKR